MSYLVAYVSTLLVFGAIDALWLSQTGPALYRPVLGDILAQNVRIAPAVVFYLLYPIGLVVFVVLPALRNESAATALGYGVLLGLMAYATYDLTNYATLRNWTFSITAIDMAYGAFVSGVASVAAYFTVRVLAGWLGGTT